MTRIGLYSNYYNNYALMSNKKNSTPANITLPTQKSLNDTVSFKGTKTVNPEVAKKGFKSLLLAIAAFLGIKTVKDSTNTENATPDNKPLSDVEKLTQDLRNAEFSYQSGRDGEWYTREAFNETAIKGIVNVYKKRGPEEAYKLSKILEGESEMSKEATNYIIDKFKTEPETLEKYSTIKCKDGKEVKFNAWKSERLMRAADVDSKLTDEIISRIDDANPLYFKYNKTYDDIYDFVVGAQNQDPQAINKYLYDDRLPLSLKNVLKLAKLDKDYSKEIEEMISFISSVELKYLDVSFIPEMMDSYLENPNAVKDLVKIYKTTDARYIKPLLGSYNENPELTVELANKAVEEGYNYDPDGVAEVVAGVQKYAKQIELLAGKNWKEMPVVELKKVVAEAKKYYTSIDRIAADGRMKEYGKLKDIYERNPDKVITQELIDLSEDEMAKIFKLV